MLALVLMLAACSGNRPIGDPQPVGKTPPPVTMGVVVGLPPDTVTGFKTALALAAGQHDIGIVEGAMQSGSFSLSGTFQTASENGAARLDYSFELRDGDGVLADTLTGSESLGPVTSGDPLSAVTPAVLERIADQTARRLASRLALLGFATRVTSLITPPADLFAEAKPGARFDIDMETLNGPIAPEPDGLAPIANEGDMTATAAIDPIVPPPPETAPGNDVEIRVVAVMPVEGTSGAGNVELTQAMRRTLKSAGWPVVSDARADALIVRGKVDMSKPVGDNQVVALRWFVETPRGKPLGDVRQSNSVLAGSLDRGWGSAAEAVAEAAAGGIFEIIKSYR